MITTARQQFFLASPYKSRVPIPQAVAYYWTVAYLEPDRAKGSLACMHAHAAQLA